MTFSAEGDISGGRRHFRRRRHFFLQILDRLLSPTNFPHKHHGAISSRYAQIRIGFKFLQIFLHARTELSNLRLDGVEIQPIQQFNNLIIQQIQQLNN